MSRGGRRRARELALQVLYAIDLGPRRCGRPPLPAHDVELGADGDELEAALTASEEAGGYSDDAPLAAETRRVFDAVGAHFEASPAARSLAWDLVEAVSELTEALDGRIAARSRNWRVERMAAVDRNVLRLGAYELGETNAPAAVVIDEAIELARRYGSDTSPAFVNGILDALASDLRSGRDGAEPDPGDGPEAAPRGGPTDRPKGESA